MRLRSRGLGRKELIMDFREYRVVREGDEVVISGTIREPVTWDFSIRVCEDDLAGLAKIGFDTRMLGFLLRAALKRDKRHHWTKDRDEHLAEAVRRRESAVAREAGETGRAVAASTSAKASPALPPGGAR